eukprot:3744824-Rhodomonas_salina.2
MFQLVAPYAPSVPDYGYQIVVAAYALSVLGFAYYARRLVVKVVRVPVAAVHFDAVQYHLDALFHSTRREGPAH